MILLPGEMKKARSRTWEKTLIVSRKIAAMPAPGFGSLLDKDVPSAGQCHRNGGAACGKSSAGDSSNVNIEAKTPGQRIAFLLDGLMTAKPALPRAGSFEPSDHSN